MVCSFKFHLYILNDDVCYNFTGFTKAEFVLTYNSLVSMRNTEQRTVSQALAI